MALIDLGREQSGETKTLTLRQYIACHGKVPERTYVKLVFPPGKYDQWSLVTEAGFRVSFNASSDLYEDFQDNLSVIVADEQALFVCVTDLDKAKWKLATDTDELCFWTLQPWGYRAEIQERPKKPSSKKSARERIKGEQLPLPINTSEIGSEA